MNTTRTPPARLVPLLMAGLLLVPGVPAHAAGLLDGLFGSSSAGGAQAEPGRRSWTIHEFTTIRLVARESGAVPNQHPAVIQPEVLRSQLAQVRYVVRGDATEALFAGSELDELVEPLSQALASAGPGDDVLLLSSSRRGGGILTQPQGVTARLFVQGNALQLIVHDTRYEFMNQYLGSRVPPTFTYGSRASSGSPQLRSASAKGPRGDWLALPLIVTAATNAPAGPMPAVLPAAAAPAAAATPAPAPAAAPPAAPMPRPRDPGFADEIEQRLITLKRLRDRGLITEEEYQQKRKEILQQL
ncbi:MAG: SHOCT domain-containing protein [Piscinibacter sp.]|nr:SHOCT domain-containing protein [Piscinibacter sp.]